MSDIKATLDIKDWNSTLENIKKNVRNPFELLQTAYGTLGYKNIIEHFNNESGPEGPWKKRSFETNRVYQMLGKKNARYSANNKILQLTGLLRQSITPTSTKRFDSNAILIFSNVRYSGKHDRGEEGMPKRSFMWFSEKVKTMMAELISKNVMDKK